MRHLAVTCLLVSFSMATFGQQPFQTENWHQTKRSQPVKNGELSSSNSGPALNALPTPASSSAAETVIGTSTYDLQTNNAVARRLFRLDNGTMSAVWTYSDDNNVSWADRGTGYNHFDGSSWGAQPAQRIENIRTGWPEVVVTSTGRELVIAHDFAAQNLYFSDRAVANAGSWTETNATFLTPTTVWPRMAVGGNNGQTIHSISITFPDGSPGAFGLDGALLYARSLNGGQTWDIQNVQLPGADTSNFVGFNADDYAIHAKGDTVAVVAAGLGQGVALWKSYDNGTNWTMTWVVEPAIAKFDEAVHNTDLLLNGDSMYTSDGAITLILDDNGMAHMAWGGQYLINDDLTDGLLTFFPAFDAIDYWNENMGSSAPITIGTSPLTAIVGLADWGFMGLSSFPSSGIDDNGCLYITYSAVTDDNNTVQNYRHVFGVKSCDGGCTWSAPVDLTPDDAFADCVYASTAANLGSNIEFIYQRDVEPGGIVQGDEDPIGENEIVFVSEPGTLLDGPANVCNAFITGASDFCAGDSVLLSASCGSAWAWSTGATTQSIWVSSYDTVSVAITTDCGVLTASTVLSATTAPPVAAISGSNALCPGDSIELAAVSSTGTSYLWSTGATNASIWASNSGTYTVTITNCVGSDSTAHTVAMATAPALDSLTSNGGGTSICEGDGSIVLSVAGASSNAVAYQWYLDGSAIAAPVGNAATVAVNSSAQSGSYTCTIYNVCGDSAVASGLGITVHPAPAQPTISYSGGTAFTCNESGASYQWYLNGSALTGETGQTYTAALNSTVLGQDVAVLYTDANGCVSQLSQTTVSVGDAIGLKQVTLYPNPANDQLTIVTPIGYAGTCSIVDATGRIVAMQRFGGANTAIKFDLSPLAEGIYSVAIKTQTDLHTQALVIAR